MRKCMLLASWVLLICTAVSCSNKEQILEGLYKGMSSAEESRMARDPSYDPLQNKERDRTSYQEYRRERELVIED